MVRRRVARDVRAVSLLRLDATPLICAVVGVVARTLLGAGGTQHGARHDRSLAVDEVRDDLDQVHPAVWLALEDGAHRVGHVEVAIVGILQLLDAEGRGLLGAEIIRLVAMLDVAPDRLECVLELDGHGELALLEGGQGHVAILADRVFLGQGLDHDRQSHARAGSRHGQWARAVGRSSGQEQWVGSGEAALKRDGAAAVGQSFGFWRRKSGSTVVESCKVEPPR